MCYMNSVHCIYLMLLAIGLNKLFLIPATLHASPMRGRCLANVPSNMLTVGNVKIVIFERSCYCCIHMQTFRTVWLLRNLHFLDGKLCLRDVL